MNYTNETEATETVITAPIEHADTAPVKAVEVVPSAPVTQPKADNATKNKRVKALNSAASKDSTLAGQYRVATNLNMRHGAGMSEQVMTVVPKNTTVRNYGFYTEANDDKWLYVQAVLNNVVYSGFCSSKYLDKI